MSDNLEFLKLKPHLWRFNTVLLHWARLWVETPGRLFILFASTYSVIHSCNSFSMLHRHTTPYHIITEDNVDISEPRPPHAPNSLLFRHKFQLMVVPSTTTEGTIVQSRRRMETTCDLFNTIPTFYSSTPFQCIFATVVYNVLLWM